MKTTLLDADIIIWKAASLGQDIIKLDNETIRKPNWQRMWAIANDMVKRWSSVGDAQQMILCVTDRCEGGQSFRFSLFDDYHANRKSMVRPEKFLDLHWKLVEKYHGVFHPGLEGDDILGILATCGEYQNPIIITEDKDLWSVPCSIFFPTRSKEIYKISEETANRYWFRQALIGDPADNYKGCRGVGKEKAKKLLAGSKTIGEMWKRTRKCFLDAGHSEEYALQQVRMARILRNEDINEDWSEIKLWHPTQTQTMKLSKPKQPLSALELLVY